MRQWLISNRREVVRWVAFIGGALIVFLLTRGTSYSQLGIGILASAVALLVCLAIFEAIWRAGNAVTSFLEEDRKD